MPVDAHTAAPLLKKILGELFEEGVRPVGSSTHTHCILYNSNRRLTQKHLLMRNRLIVTQQKDLIKGNLWHAVMFFKDQR